MTVGSVAKNTPAKPLISNINPKTKAIKATNFDQVIVIAISILNFKFYLVYDNLIISL